jgi:ribosomal protein S14
MKENIRATPRKIELSAVAPAPCEQFWYHHKRCAQCGKPFGLIRHHRAGKQFCSQYCKDRQAEAIQKLVYAKGRQYDFSKGNDE